MSDFLRYAMLRVGAGVIRVLPLGISRGIGAWIGGWSGRLMGRKRTMVRRHMTRVGFTGDALEKAVDSVFRQYGVYWVEALWVRPGRLGRITESTTLVGREHVEAALTAGNGLVLALPHIGNWEFAGPLSSVVGFRLVAVAERLKNRWIRDWFVNLRSKLGIEIVFAGDRNSMRELEEVLRGNGAVALVCDRDLGGRGVPVEFFGESTTLPAGPAMLSLRAGAPILPVAAYNAPGGKHRVVVRPAIDPPRDLDRSEALAVTTQRLATELEILIREHPEQWHLLQPNWPSDRQVEAER